MSYSSEILLSRLKTFAENCRDLSLKLRNSSYNRIYTNQLLRSSSSPGANYIEAIEASSSKEFALRLKICRKEIKEAYYWLGLIETSNKENLEILRIDIILKKEASELLKIFAASIITSERNQKMKDKMLGGKSGNGK